MRRSRASFSTWLVYVFQLQDGKWRIVHDQNTALDYAAFARSAGIDIQQAPTQKAIDTLHPYRCTIACPSGESAPSEDQHHAE